MEELQQQIEEPVEEQGKERHPADTLNDGSVVKLIFFVPALVLHTVIAVFIVVKILNFAANLLWLAPLIGRWTWSTSIYFYLGSMFGGLLWSPFLDRWLFKTSKYVWLLPLIWFLFYFLRFVNGGDPRYAMAIFFEPRMNWFFLSAVAPLVASIGYCVGAWIRRSSGDEVPELLAAAGARHVERLSAETAWNKLVELWRAGRRA